MYQSTPEVVAHGPNPAALLQPFPTQPQQIPLPASAQGVEQLWTVAYWMCRKELQETAPANPLRTGVWNMASQNNFQNPVMENIVNQSLDIANIEAGGNVTVMQNNLLNYCKTAVAFACAMFARDNQNWINQYLTPQQQQAVTAEFNKMSRYQQPQQQQGMGWGGQQQAGWGAQQPQQNAWAGNGNVQMSSYSPRTSKWNNGTVSPNYMTNDNPGSHGGGWGAPKETNEHASNRATDRITKRWAESPSEQSNAWETAKQEPAPEPKKATAMVAPVYDPPEWVVKEQDGKFDFVPGGGAHNYSVEELRKITLPTNSLPDTRMAAFMEAFIGEELPAGSTMSKISNILHVNVPASTVEVDKGVMPRTGPDIAYDPETDGLLYTFRFEGENLRVAPCITKKDEVLMKYEDHLLGRASSYTADKTLKAGYKMAGRVFQETPEAELSYQTDPILDPEDTSYSLGEAPVKLEAYAAARKSLDRTSDEVLVYDYLMDHYNPVVVNVDDATALSDMKDCSTLSDCLEIMDELSSATRSLFEADMVEAANLFLERQMSYDFTIDELNDFKDVYDYILNSGFSQNEADLWLDAAVAIVRGNCRSLSTDKIGSEIAAETLNHLELSEQDLGDNETIFYRVERKCVCVVETTLLGAGLAGATADAFAITTKLDNAMGRLVKHLNRRYQKLEDVNIYVEFIDGDRYRVVPDQLRKDSQLFVRLNRS